MNNKHSRNRGGPMGRMSTVGELFRFMWKRKLYWLMPMLLLLILFSALLIFAQGSAVAPFIYSLF
jgi:hypothetical protein